MQILNDIYDGYDNINESIESLKIIAGSTIDNYKIIKFNNQYYGIAIENAHKQLILCKDKIWYRDKEGYLICKSKEEFSFQYIINNPLKSDYTNILYEECERKGYAMVLFEFKSGEANKVHNPVNCYFNLLATIFTDYFYDKKEFENYNYSNDKNIRLMKEYLLYNYNLNTVSINPFKSKVRINVYGKIVEIEYCAVTDSYNKNYITSFQVKPILSLDNIGIKLNQLSKNEILYKKDQDEVAFITKFYEGSEAIIKLANNKSFELSEENINYLIDNDLDLKLYMSNLDDIRLNQMLNRNGLCIKYIKNPNITMMLAAVLSKPEAIKILINKITEEQLEIIVMDHKDCIKFIDNLPMKIQKKLLEEDINNINYFKDINVDLLKLYLDKIVNIENLSECVKYKIKEAEGKNAVYNDPIYINRIVTYEELEIIYGDIFDKVQNSKEYDIKIINSEEALNLHIDYIYKKIKCTKLDVASGYIRLGGMYLLDSIISNSIENKIKTRIVVGSLKDYSNNLFCKDIDINTVKYLNNLIENDSIELRTNKQRFYHGKIYYFHGEKYTSIICGSSNISKNGMYGNHETNMIIILDNSCEKLIDFTNYFEQLCGICEKLNCLNLEMFADENIMIETEENYSNSVLNKCIEVDREFDYLRSFNPSEEVSDIQIFEGYSYENQYTVFRFEEYNNLLILESLEYQNAIYIFEGIVDIEKFIHSLSGKDDATSRDEYRHRINHTKDGSYKHRVSQILLEYEQKFATAN